MINCTFRRLTGDDVATYHALRLRMLQEVPTAFASSYEDEAGKPVASVLPQLGLTPESTGNFMLGAFLSDGRLIGVVGLKFSNRRHERHRATVVGTWVDPGHTRDGIGTALMQELVRQALEHPALEQLHLTVTSGNEPAIRLYLRTGFVLSGVEPAATKISGKYYDKQHMYLPLRS